MLIGEKWVGRRTSNKQFIRGDLLWIFCQMCGQAECCLLCSAHAGISPMGLASMVLAGAWLAVAGVGKEGVSRGLIPWGQLVGPGSWCKQGPGPMGSASRAW